MEGGKCGTLKGIHLQRNETKEGFSKWRVWLEAEEESRILLWKD